MAPKHAFAYSSLMSPKPVVVRPDIIVMDRETPRFMLVAEVKSIAGEQAVTAGWEQLKQYMLATNCTVGLLITPIRTWVLRDTFEDYTNQSIQVAGDFSSAAVLGDLRKPIQEDTLALQAQSWLERLSANYPSALPTDPAARKLIQQIVVPAVVEGRVFLEPSIHGDSLAMASEG